jgi:hypothetical protein
MRSDYLLFSLILVLALGVSGWHYYNRVQTTADDFSALEGGLQRLHRHLKAGTNVQQYDIGNEGIMFARTRTAFADVHIELAKSFAAVKDSIILVVGKDRDSLYSDTLKRDFSLLDSQRYKEVTIMVGRRRH